MSRSLKMLRAFAVLSVCVVIVGGFAVTASANKRRVPPVPPVPPQTVCSEDGSVCATWPSTLAPGSTFPLRSTVKNTSPTYPLAFWLTTQLGQTLSRVKRVAPGQSGEMTTTLQAPDSGCMSLSYFEAFAKPLPPGDGVWLFTAQICA